MAKRGPEDSETRSAHWFDALTSRRVSRNKNYASFADEGLRKAHRRYLTVQGLKEDAERLTGIPNSFCGVAAEAEGIRLSLVSPTLRYRRQVRLLPHEWAWLHRQAGIQALLKAAVERGAGPPSLGNPTVPAVNPQQRRGTECEGMSCN